jgi:hypothetical protein
LDISFEDSSDDGRRDGVGNIVDAISRRGDRDVAIGIGHTPFRFARERHTGAAVIAGAD